MIEPNRTWRTASGRPSDAEERGEHGQDQGPDDRARVAAAAAEDRRPADDRRRDRRQHVLVGERDAGMLVKPGDQEPGDGGEERRDHVEHDQHLPRAGTGQAGGDRVVADRVQQPAIARSPETQQDDAAPRARRRAGCTAGSPKSRSEPSVRELGGTPAPVWTIASCHTLASPRTTRPMPRVMISGWTRKTPTPIPVRRPTSAAIDEGDDDGDRQALAVRRASRRRTRPSRRPRPTERSMPPVSIVSVWQPARIASGTAARSVTPAQSALTMPGRASSRHDEEDREQDEQRHDRAVAEQAPPRRDGQPRAARDRALPTVPVTLGSAAAGRGCRP